MFNKLNNRKGCVAILMTWGLATVIAATVHFTKYQNGQWGAGGSDSLQARQAKIIANGGHINQAPCDRPGECKI